MTRKKKQSGKSPRRLARQQRRQSERAAKRRPSMQIRPASGQFDPKLVRAALPYFDGELSMTSSPSAMERAMTEGIRVSHVLADEPELRDYLIRPMESAKAIAEAA